jgi:hypothetical protein
MKTVIKNEIFPLFLLISFPINTWSIYIFFYNFEWVAERTTVGDAIGYGAYALVIALLESLFVSIFIALLYLLMKKNHDQDTSSAILGLTFLIISFWVIVGRVNSSQNISLIPILFAIKDKYHFQYRYFLALIVLSAGAISASMLLPPFLVHKYNKLKRFSLSLFQRLELLSYVYLALNLVSIVVVIIRNMGDIQI